jgi:hypothetical protein
MSASPAQNQVSRQLAVYSIRYPVDDTYGSHQMMEDVVGRFGLDSIVRFNFGMGSHVPCVRSTRIGEGDHWRHEARALVLTDLDAHALMSDVDGAVVKVASA